MSLDHWIKLLDAFTRLLTVIVWPALILFVILRFRPAIQDFLANLSQFTLKGAGIDISASREKAAAALTAAAVARADGPIAPENAATDARQAVATVSAATTPAAMRRAASARVLWVDDNPANNNHERQSLEALGVQFVLAISTDGALDLLKQEKFDLILSDMNRPPDERAGYTLLDALRNSGNKTPYIIYASARSAASQSEALQHGAIGCTNRPDELFSMVLSALSPW